MTFTKFISITAAIYVAYYLVVILLDKLKQSKTTASAGGGRQIVEVPGYDEQPKRVSSEGQNEREDEIEKKNFNSQSFNTFAPDQVQEVNSNDLWHDLGLETIAIDGIEVNEQNILKLISEAQ